MAALLLLFAIVPFIISLVPPSDEALGRSTALLERGTYYEFLIDGKPAFYADDYDNWTTAHFTTNGLDIPMKKQIVAGTWARSTYRPFCSGRLLTLGTDPSQWESEHNKGLADSLKQRLPVLKKRIEMLGKRIEELQYFMRVHNVTDEGYNQVANYETEAVADLKTLKAIVTMLENSKQKEISVRWMQKYTLLGHQGDEQRRTDCQLLSFGSREGTCIVQTIDHTMPDSISALYTRSAKANDYRLKLQDSLDTTIDTLNAIIAIGNDTYHGELNDTLRPDGHGILLTPNGKRYDGMWVNGKREGFGISLDSNGRVRIGEWKDDVYKGEKPTYSADHIYGIDISRHQHEKNGRKLPVSWSDVRITHLGNRSDKRISGDVDYPIAFCYIKATEGTSIYNAYYNYDYAQARRHKIRVGTYHFLSLKSPVAKQAEYFLKHVHLRPGDLPPMLDVEPSDALINKFGGTEALLNGIRTWLKIVEERTGVKPIIYSYQMFFDKYFSQADDIKRDYRVWIARYGEYKPDLRLTFWQLGSDARVKGFVGDVDVNVFNGYHDQWEEFLEQDSIR